MKRKILLVLALFSVIRGINAQCSVNYQVANNCTSWGDVISYFQMNAIASTGNTGCSANGYGSFATPVWNLQGGNTYTFTASLGGGGDDEGFGIWIDLDNDGFYAPSEMVYSAAVPAPTINGSFTLPSNVSGQGIHMRLMCSFQHVFVGTDACYDYVGTWGETEDHLVNLGCPTASNISITASNTLVCLGGTVTLQGGGFANYSWSGGISNNVPFSPSATTNYTLTATSPSTQACPSVTGTAVKTISVTTVPLVINASANPVTICAGSSATLTGSGATSYTWNPSASNGSTAIVSPTSTTQYTLTGANPQGCPGTATLNINVLPAPTVSISSSTGTSVCAGDPVNLVASGNGITYTWSPGGATSAAISANPANTTVYTATASSAAGCKNTASKIIYVFPNPVIYTMASSQTVCANDAVTLTATGASSYSWSTGGTTSSIVVHPSAAGVYAVTGTNTTTCHGMNTISIDVFAPVISVSSNTSVCQGGTVTISAMDGESYSWDNGATTPALNVSPANTTTYTVIGMVSQDGLSCPDTNAVVVSVNELPVITAAASPTAICRTRTATLTVEGAGTSGTYQWNNSLGSTASVTVSPVADQTYNVSGTDANGCKGTTTVAVIVSPCTGIEAVSANVASLLIYPNPSNGEFTVSSDEVIDLDIRNELGQQVSVISLTGATHEVKVNSLANGVYFISGKNANGSVNQKIIVTH